MNQAKKGFTLLELAFVVSLALLLILSAIPAWQNFSLKYRLREQVDRLQTAINFSRNLALQQQKPLIVRPISYKDWSKGMCLFVDTDNNHRLNENQILLKIWRWDDRKLTVAWHGFQSDHYLEFTPDLANSYLSGRFIVSAKGANMKRSLIVNRLGRTRQDEENG
jgi:type IV fimbrial biogenesis protein FimT